MAVLIASGFDRSQLVQPRQALLAAGAEVELVGVDKLVKSRRGEEWGEAFVADVGIDEAGGKQYDALVIPGGSLVQDFLGPDERVTGFVQSFALQGKPIAAISEGCRLLLEANLVRGRRLTPVPALAAELSAAGAECTDDRLTVDENLITTSWAANLPLFCASLIALIAENAARHEGGAQAHEGPNGTLA